MNNFSIRSRAAGAALMAGLAGLVAASGAQAETLVSMWVHAGPGPERDVYIASVRAFNDASPDVKIKLLILPEGKYSDQVNAAALANNRKLMMHQPLQAFI